MTPERFEARQSIYREMLKTSGFARKTERLSAGIVAALDGASVSRCCVRRRRRRSICKLEPKEVFDAYNTGPLRPGLPARAAARRKPARGSSRSRREYIPFEYWDTHNNGHDRAGEAEEADRPPNRAAGAAISKNAVCSTARSSCSPASSAATRWSKAQPDNPSEPGIDLRDQPDDAHRTQALRHAPPLHRRGLAC